MPTYTEAGTPLVYSSSAYVGSPTLSFNFTSVTEKIKEAEERIDKHVDQLEEDIEYFNNKLKELSDKLEYEEAINVEQNTKIKDLENQVSLLDGHINYLEGRLALLEGKINGNNLS